MSWSWSDAWILASAAAAESDGEPDLDGVIGWSRAFNRSAVTREELVEATRRLTAAGLVELVGREFRLTDDGHRLVARASGRADGRPDVPPCVLEELGAVSIDGPPGAVSISEGAFGRAASRYAARRRLWDLRRRAVVEDDPEAWRELTEMARGGTLHHTLLDEVRRDARRPRRDAVTADHNARLARLVVNERPDLRRAMVDAVLDVD